METFKTSSVCSRFIEFEVKDGILTDVKFIGGCAGNTQGVAKLAKNRPVEEVISLLEGTLCRNGTSCPDQLAKALKEYQAKNKQ